MRPRVTMSNPQPDNMLSNAMTPVEAMQCLDRIRAGLKRAAGELAKAKAEAVMLKDRRGWESVMQSDGTIAHYRSWAACAQAELGKSLASIYRYLNTGMVERSLTEDGLPVPSLPLAWATELGRLPPELRKDALRRAEAETPSYRKTTTKEIRAVCDAMETAYRTGGFVGAAGEMIGMQAAITENLANEIATEVQRVIDHKTPPVINAHGSILSTGPCRIVITVDNEVAIQAMSLVGRDIQLIVKESEHANSMG